MKVFLTGASAGIGAASAKVLCEAGHQVWGSSRSIDRLPPMENFHPVELDLLNEQSLRETCDRVWEEAGGIDVLINNAGQAVFGSLEQMPIAAIRQQFEILFFAPLILQQRFTSRMRAGGGGLIINISSLATELPIPFMGPYSAAKAALSVASSVLRLERGDHRIRWVDLRPGDISTDFNEAVTRSAGADSETAGKAWRAIENNMAVAPAATLVAERILGIVEGRQRCPVQRVGDWFQTVLSPLGPKFLPAALMEKLIRGYYGLR